MSRGPRTTHSHSRVSRVSLRLALARFSHAQVHEAREAREARFTSTVERVVRRNGKCLIPVFALGRAQELLLILDEVS